MRIVLTIIAVALVAVLSTALVVPLFIDWPSHRAEIADRLSVITGGKVALDGPITVQLLPTPYLELGGGSVTGAERDAPRLSFASARLELALVKLASGVIRFTEIRLEKPVLTIARGPDGSLRLPVPPPGRADAVGFDRLLVRDGRIRIAGGAGGTEKDFDGVQLDADAPSLAGPYHVSGRFSASNSAPVVFRLASETTGQTGVVIRASVDAGLAWPALEFDGSLSGAGSLSGSATVIGAIVSPEGPMPWRATGRMKADLDHATIEPAEVRLGSEERALRADGVVALAYGSTPRLSIDLKAKQANLDALLRRKGEDSVAPARAFSLLSGTLSRALEHSGPFAIDANLSAETVILGGDTLSDISANLQSAQNSPLHTRFDLGLPGRSKLQADGEVEMGAAPEFHGTVDFASDNVAVLREWSSEGAPEFAAKLPILDEAIAYRSASLSGDVEASRVGFSGHNLKIAFDRSTLTGSLAFTLPVGADPGRLYTDLSSDSLDVAKLPNLNASAALLGSLDLSISLQANALHIAQINGTEIDSGSFAFKVTKRGQDVSLDRLSLADLGGAYVDVQGAAGPDGTTASGNLRADRLQDFALLISRLAPSDWSRTLADRSPLLSPTSLAFDARGSTASTGGPQLTSLNVNGTLAQTQTTLSLDPGPKGDGQLLTFKLDSPNVGSLLRQLGLGGAGTANERAHLTLHASGAWQPGYAIDASGTLAGVDIAGRGRLLPAAPNDEARLFGSAKLKGVNASPLISALGLAPTGGTIVPIDAAADVTLRGDRWTASHIAATVAGVKASGDLNYQPDLKPDIAVALVAPDPAPSSDAADKEQALAPQAPPPVEISGELSLDRIPLSEIVALALGASQPSKAGARWSDAKFAVAPFSPPPTAVHVSVGTLDLTDGLAAQRFATRLRLDKGKLDLDDIEMTIDGGVVHGRATLRRDNETATLTGALDADSLAIKRPGFSGRVGGTLEFASTGRSPAALIEGLAGSGTARFAAAALARSDPVALDRVVTRAQAPDAPLDETNIAFALGKELDKAPLPIPDGSTPIALNAGTIKFGPLAISQPRGDAALTGALDLSKLSLETRLAITSPSTGLKFWSGPPPSAALAVQDALDAPKRQVDVSALSAALATQAIARESDRIAALEADIRERAFFNRRLKGERFMDRRTAEIEDWRVEQARLKGLADRLAAERAEAERAAAAQAAAEKAAAEKAAAERIAAEKAAAERAAAEKATAEKSALEKAGSQPALPPDLPLDSLPVGKPPVAPNDSSSRADELRTNAPPAVVPMPPIKPRVRPAPERSALPDPTAGGLY